MTKLSPNQGEYLPAAGHDSFLPFYDLLSRLAGVRKLHRRLIRDADLASGQRVLEIGCGTGNLSIAAKRAFPGIVLTATDPDPLALRRAHRKSAGIAFERAFAEHLPYDDGSFDRVLSALMLHHVDDEVKATALAEVLRVMAPGGSFHVADFVEHRHGFFSHGMGRAQIATDLASMLGDAGFAVVDDLGRLSTHVGTVGFWRASVALTDAP
jgi:ubiquinone/menaquinone biosynthesis C-methylase UbiE